MPKTKALLTALAASAALLASLTLSGCTSTKATKPEDTVLAFMSALEQGQAQEAATLSNMTPPDNANAVLLPFASYRR